MRDLDSLLAEVDAVLNLPPLPALDPPVSLDDGWNLRDDQGRLLDPDLWPPVLPSGRFGCDPVPVDERPRPRPPRPFPPAEEAAIRRRAEQKEQARPRPWFGRWRRA